LTTRALSGKVKEIDPLGRITTFGYDAAGSRTLKVNARAQRVTYVYDANRRLPSDVEAASAREGQGGRLSPSWRSGTARASRPTSPDNCPAATSPRTHPTPTSRPDARPRQGLGGGEVLKRRSDS